MSEQEALLNEINDHHTSHQRRRDIGDRLDEIGDTRPGVGVREDGLPEIVWLPVAPGGIMGTSWGSDTLTVSPFYIAKYQITCAQYETFIKAADGFDNPEWWRWMPKEHQRQPLKEQNYLYKNNPRDSLSWYQSVAFARWLNKRLRGRNLIKPKRPGTTWVIGQNAQVRLPTEWEWQWAAYNSVQLRRYPWGDWQEGYANTYEAGLNRAVAVGMYPHGAAACGALDLSGNLFEWCANDYFSPTTIEVGNNELKTLIGGCFRHNHYSAGTTSRGNVNQITDIYCHGLRLVISTPLAVFG